MSSLAAARADSFYYPPDHDPQQDGSLARASGAKGKNQYEQKGLIRFELPYDGWCEGCGRHLGKGVRFNAKKEACGRYHTTTLWQFTMKCPSCPQAFVIRTDPERRDYAFVAGVRRKREDYAESAADHFSQLG